MSLEGEIVSVIGSAFVGQGIETICTQIAADALELPMERIKIFTDRRPTWMKASAPFARDPP